MSSFSPFCHATTTTTTNMGAPAYTEIIPTRALYKGTPPALVPPTWPTFPTTTPAEQTVIVTESNIPIILAEGKLYQVELDNIFGGRNNNNIFTQITFGDIIEPNSKLIVTNRTLLGYISPSKMCTLSCHFDDTSSSLCKTISCVKCPKNLGVINSVATSIDTQSTIMDVDDNDDAAYKKRQGTTMARVWAASNNGLAYGIIDYATGSILGNSIDVVTTLSSVPLISVVVSGNMMIPNVNPILVLGNSEKIWFLSYHDPTNVLRYEWVTDIPSGAGGVLSSTIMDMVFDIVAVPKDIEESKKLVVGDDNDIIYPNILLSNLYIGTQNNLNLHFGMNSSYTTINGDSGLPTANITCMAFAKTREIVNGPIVKQLWIGTTEGISVWQKGHDPEFRYLYKERWLSGSRIKSLSVVSKTDNNNDDVVDEQSKIHLGDTIVVVAEEGVTVLEQQLFTLSKKSRNISKYTNKQS
jgi:hypothetical protein